MVLDGCPMFSKAYMGRKRILPMLSLHAQGPLFLFAIFLPRTKSVGRGYAPSFPAHVRWANMGHPSREDGFVLCSNHSPADDLHLGHLLIGYPSHPTRALPTYMLHAIHRRRFGSSMLERPPCRLRIRRRWPVPWCSEHGESASDCAPER
jgi:hypothetical protein